MKHLATILITSSLFLLPCLTGCNSPSKMRDVELKGMCINGYSETLVIGTGKLTSIPGEREALAAHYSEDTAWLSPGIKTHELDLFLVGSNTVDNSVQIISSICKAFAEVAPSISSNDAARASSPSAFDVLNSAGARHAETEQAKVAAAKAVALAKSVATNLVSSASSPTNQVSSASGACTTGACETK